MSVCNVNITFFYNKKQFLKLPMLGIADVIAYNIGTFYFIKRKKKKLIHASAVAGNSYY